MIVFHILSKEFLKIKTFVSNGQWQLKIKTYLTILTRQMPKLLHGNQLQAPSQIAAAVSLEEFNVRRDLRSEEGYNIYIYMRTN